MGEKNKVIKNSPATTRDVKPDLPPTATPEVDSTYALDGVEPNVAPTVVATASAVSAALALGSFPFFINPACSATPIIVPVVSKMVTSKNANTTVYSPCVNTPVISISKKTGAGGKEATPPYSSIPVKNPITPVISIPRKRAPFTFQAISAKVINKPTKVSKVTGSVRSPKPTIVSSFGITIPDIFKPRNAINRPIPEVIPNFKE